MAGQEFTTEITEVMVQTVTLTMPREDADLIWKCLSISLRQNPIDSECKRTRELLNQMQLVLYPPKEVN